MYLRFFKRFIDLLSSVLILPVFFIFYLMVGIAIKIEDGGSILYSGIRLGKNKNKFKMYKFRSMNVDATDIRNQDGSTFNSKYDARVTRVGKYIRELSIDEIPQIINVIKGDMSLVGPRPSPTGNEHLYPKEYLRKFSIRPGVTGYTQVKFRNKCTLEQRQKSDLFYVDNLSLLLDLKILYMTIYKVFKREGVYRENSHIEQ